jgi:hypothetical protein
MDNSARPPIVPQLIVAGKFVSSKSGSFFTPHPFFEFIERWQAFTITS